MTTKRIEEIAGGAGAELAPQLNPTEIVSLVADPIGIVTVTTAAGEEFQLALERDVPPDFNRCAGALLLHDVLRMLVPDVVRYGGRLPPGVTFHRRVKVVDGVRSVEFTEAGR